MEGADRFTAASPLDLSLLLGFSSSHINPQLKSLMYFSKVFPVVVFSFLEHLHAHPLPLRPNRALSSFSSSSAFTLGFPDCCCVIAALHIRILPAFPQASPFAFFFSVFFQSQTFFFSAFLFFYTCNASLFCHLFFFCPYVTLKRLSFSSLSPLFFPKWLCHRCNRRWLHATFIYASSISFF